MTASGAIPVFNPLANSGQSIRRPSSVSPDGNMGTPIGLIRSCCRHDHSRFVSTIDLRARATLGADHG